MTGQKGRSGGKREGAGRKPAPSVKGRRIQQGETFLYHEFSPEGAQIDMGQLATVERMTRTLIVLRFPDGGTIHLGY